MKNNIKVSVLTPIYNHNISYVRECLDSLKAQTLQEIEFILIDNGATPEAKELIAEYEKLDSRFKIIHIAHNIGYGAAMNRGLDEAQGEYIGIVESDDWISPTMYADLYSIAKGKDLRVLKSLYYESQNGKNKLISNYSSDKYNKILKTDDVPNFLYFHASPWSMIYKNEFLKQYNIKFREGGSSIGNDVGFVIKVYVCAENLMIINNAYYHYRVDNTNSCMKNKNANPILDTMLNKEYFALKEWGNNLHISDHAMAIIDRRKFFNIKCLINHYKINIISIILISKHLKRNQFNTKLLTSDEINLFKQIKKHPLKYYINNHTDIVKKIQKIISVRNTPNKKHKIITILGLKIKIKRNVKNNKIRQLDENNFSNMLSSWSTKLTNDFRNMVRYEVSQIVAREVSTALMIQKLHMQTFPQFKNINAGKDVAIIGCGPTVKYYNSEINAVNIALNKSILLDQFKFSYLFSWDYNGFIKYGEVDFFDNVRNMDCIKFFGRFLSETSVEIPVLPDDEKNKIYHFYSSARYGLPAGAYGRVIHTDIETHPLADFMSVSFAALHFALYTQPRKIYLIGLDTTNSGHILNCNHQYYIDDLMEGYKKFKEHINRFYPHIEVISVNPVGLKGLFKDVYTQSYIDEHPELQGEEIEILNSYESAKLVNM